MNVLPDILATDSNLDSDYEESQEEIAAEVVHADAQSFHHVKSAAQDRDKSPFAAAHENKKRQAQTVSSIHGKAKARRSDSAIILPRGKHSTSSRASTGNVDGGRCYKASSKGGMHSKDAGSSKVTPGRQEDSLTFLSAERKRLEKENKEKKRRLQELRKQEMLIEAAAKKGGPFEKQLAEVSEKSAERSKFMAQNDLAGNVFASMDRDLAASSDDEEEEKVESSEEQPPELQRDAENNSVVQSDEMPSSFTEIIDEASADEDDSVADDDEADVESENDVASGTNDGDSDDASGADDDAGDNASDASASSQHRAETRSSKAAISPVRWKKSNSAEGAKELSDEGVHSEKSRISRKRQSDGSRQELSNTEKLLRYIFLDAKFYLIKSSNHENVGLAQARGVWSSPPITEARLNRAFRSCSNVIVVFSVAESRRFQGFARLATESDKNHPPIRWVLPAGMSARSLSGVFTLDWINRNELDFSLTSKLKNSWNENNPVRIGRDGQVIEPVVGETLCRLFPVDRDVDLHAIALKSREAMDKRGLDPHELYKRADVKRRHAKTAQRRKERRLQEDLKRQRQISAYEAQQKRMRRHSLPRRSSRELLYGRMRAFPRRRSDSSEVARYCHVRNLLSMHPISPPASLAFSGRRPSFRHSPAYSRRPSFDRPRSFGQAGYERSKYFERRSIVWDRPLRDRR